MEPEFAPQYSPKERLRRLLVHGVLGLLALMALYWWVLPRYRSFLGEASCESLLGMRGSTILLYGAFVGIPLAAAVVIVLLTARSSLEAIATRRYPPPNRKVFGRVKIKKGWQAIAFALMPAMAITYLCILSSQGLTTATQMARDAQRAAVCGPESKNQKGQPKKEGRRDSTAESRPPRPAR